MTKKQKIISAYFLIAILFAFYNWIFGINSYKGFFYNLGTGFVWPILIFPSLGVVIGGLIILAFVIFILAS